jgi:hypothetical protein
VLAFWQFIRLPKGSIVETCRAGSKIFKYIYIDLFIYLFIPAAFIRIISVIISQSSKIYRYIYIFLYSKQEARGTVGQKKGGK